MKLSKILQQASDSLTEKTWIKGRMFDLHHGDVCSCAHGAVQKLINSSVQSMLKKTDQHHSGREDFLYQLSSVVPDVAVANAVNLGSSLASSSAFDSASQFSSKTAFAQRPYWVASEDPLLGSLEIHFLMGMAGLTLAFNDDPWTHLSDIKQKFQHAISLAIDLGL